MRKVVLATALLLACTPSARAVDPVQPVDVLSDPGTLSRWAFLVHATVARREPDSGSRPVARLRHHTQDGTDELALALEQTTDAAGHHWGKVRLPILPNGSTRWVRRESLGGFHHVRTWLRIDRRRLEATLIRSAHG